MLDILIILVPLASGLAAYALLRRREIRPVFSGLAAMLLAFFVIAGLFSIVIATGNV